MYKAKTIETDSSVNLFIESVEDMTKRADCYALIELIERKTGFKAKMWGKAIVGFGTYHYKYASGHEGDAALVGFSPRSAAIVLYLSADFENKELLLKELGKHKTGVGCIYIKRMDQINIPILGTMIVNSVAYLQKMYIEP